ncbi:MAG: hypothetical protein WCJ58_03705 [bacterium]
MTPARVYKVNIRENILRQLIFTDRNIVLGLIILVGVLVWILGNGLAIEIKVFTTLILSGVLLVGLTARVDRQPTYKILVRAIQYTFRSKSIRF